MGRVRQLAEHPEKEPEGNPVCSVPGGCHTPSGDLLPRIPEKTTGPIVMVRNAGIGIVFISFCRRAPVMAGI